MAPANKKGTSPAKKKSAPQLRIARVYDAPPPQGDYRVLVDRIWPRGIRKEELQIDAWMKDLAPSTELRKWFNHDPKRWSTFQRRYAAELKPRAGLLKELLQQAGRRPVTLLYAARDEEHNNAVVLRDLLLKKHR